MFFNHYTDRCENYDSMIICWKIVWQKFSMILTHMYKIPQNLYIFTLADLKYYIRFTMKGFFHFRCFIYLYMLSSVAQKIHSSYIWYMLQNTRKLCVVESFLPRKVKIYQSELFETYIYLTKLCGEFGPCRNVINNFDSR